MSVNPLESVNPNPQAPPSTVPTPEPPALFKKAGGDWGKANDSYFEAANTLSRVQGELQQRDERIRQLESAVVSFGGGGQPNVSNDPLMALQTELGLPIEPFRAGIRGEVEAAVTALFGPIVAQAQAEETLSTEIENFDQLKGDTRKFMSVNPEVAELFNTVRQHDPVRAWKYAIRETILAGGGSAPAPPRSAGLPGSATPAGRGQVNPAGPSQEDRETAGWEYHRQYGDAAPALHERFRGTSIQEAVNAALQRVGRAPPE
jgi:hypothetical protein